MTISKSTHQNLCVFGSVLVAVVVGAFVVMLLSGCAYRVIPEQAAAKIEAVPHALRKQAVGASERAATHKARSKAATTPEAAQGHAEAAAEADHAAKVENGAADAVGEGMAESKPVADLVAPIVQPLAVAATAATGIPWELLITTGVTLATGALGLNRHLAAKAGEQSDAWEEAICADPDLGQVGAINYDDPKVKARALTDVQKGHLKPKAFKKIYPQG